MIRSVALSVLVAVGFCLAPSCLADVSDDCGDCGTPVCPEGEACYYDCPTGQRMASDCGGGYHAMGGC